MYRYRNLHRGDLNYGKRDVNSLEILYNKHYVRSRLRLFPLYSYNNYRSCVYGNYIRRVMIPFKRGKINLHHCNDDFSVGRFSGRSRHARIHGETIALSDDW